MNEEENESIPMIKANQNFIVTIKLSEGDNTKRVMTPTSMGAILNTSE